MWVDRIEIQLNLFNLANREVFHVESDRLLKFFKDI